MSLVGCCSNSDFSISYSDRLSNSVKGSVEQVANGLSKIKEVAIAAFNSYPPVVVLACAATIIFENPLSMLAVVASGVALSCINLSALLEPPKEENKKYFTPLDGAKGVLSVIKSIALITLKEAVAITAVSSLAAFFVTTQFGMASLAVGVISSVCVNLFLRILGGATFLMYAERDAHTQERKMPEGKAKKFIDFVEFVAPVNYSFVHFNTVDTVIHEGGHALAIKAFYAQAKPQITVFPYLGGATTFTAKAFSRLGQLLGANTSNLAIAAAGPAAAVSVAAAELALADHFEKTHPRLSRYLKLMGIANIASHLIYAYSAFEEATSSATASAVSGHDFVRMWSRGIHPYASIISIVAIPLILKTALYWSKTELPASTRLPVEASNKE